MKSNDICSHSAYKLSPLQSSSFIDKIVLPLANLTPVQWAKETSALHNGPGCSG